MQSEYYIKKYINNYSINLKMKYFISHKYLYSMLISLHNQNN